jgi:hypothetical protein
LTFTCHGGTVDLNTMPLSKSSPIESSEHTPESLATAAESALRDHGAETRKLAPIVGERMKRLALWAWQGAGSTEGMRELVLDTAKALFRSPADTFYQRPLIADPAAESWLEDLMGAVGNDTPLGQTLVASAIRLDIMAGRAVLPSTLAVLLRVDTPRIRALVKRKQLEDASASPLIAGRSGHRPKGHEQRVTAESCFRWMQENGRAPADAEGPKVHGKPKRKA